MSEEIIHETWFSRLGGAFKGMVVGAVIFVAAFPLLWWNEGRAVKRAEALTEGAAAVQETRSDRVDPADDGKFVHLTGEATTEEVLEDPDFGVAASAIRLERNVEMFQWKEEVDSTTRKKLGGGTETVKKYSYRKTWSDRAIDSGSFRDPGHDNPGALPLQSFVKTAREVRLGEYQLPDSLVASIRRNEELSVSLEDVPADWRAIIRPYGTNGYYLPASHTPGQAATTPDHTTEGARSQQPAARQDTPTPTNRQVQPAANSPQIGDVRIRYTVTRPTTVSVMSQQAGNTFAPFRTSNGNSLNMLVMGNVPASEMISRAEAQNTLWTWALRGAGFIMMGIGLGILLKPLSILADVLPIAGDFVEAGTGMISFGIAGACSLATISVAWLFYRPLIGVPLLVAGIGLIAALVYRIRKTRSARAMKTAAETSQVGTARPDENETVESLDQTLSV